MSENTLNRRNSVILLFYLITLIDGFNVPRYKIIALHRNRRNQVFQSVVDDNLTESTQQERYQKKLKERAQRCVDYPSFAVQDRVRYPSPKTTTKTTTIKVEIDEKNNLRGIDPDIGAPNDGWLTNILLKAMSSNSPLEGDLFQISNSARRSRLLNERAYAKPAPFTPENLMKPPTLEDLSPPLSSKVDTFWIGTPARVLSLGVPYFAFPYITRFLSRFVTMPPEQLDDIVSKFGPGIAILYGTFVSLTLSILYNRQQSIQENVAKESSLVTLITRDLLSLLRKDKVLAIEAGQCAADHIRTLVRGSRGGELLLLMYSDPFARMNDLIDRKEEMFLESGKTDLDGKGVSVLHRKP